MKPHSIFLTAICLPLLLLMGACKPEPKQQKYLGNYPLGEVMDYLYFRPGSYWIYECDSTQELDSQVLVSIDTPWFHKSYIDYQLLVYKKFSFSFNTNYETYYPTFDAKYCESCERGFGSVLNISGANNTGTDCVFYRMSWGFDSTRIGGGGSSPTYYSRYYDSLQVLGVWYKDIRVFKVQATSGWTKPKLNNLDKLSKYASMIYYWSKKVGLIRIEVQVGDLISQKEYIHNWNLKTYDIK